VLAAGEPVQILNIGLPDRYIEHGSHADWLAEAGLDAHGFLKLLNCRLEVMSKADKSTGNLKISG
jgi:1-deoxy-D-xylulose-5-phosphate synthase